jgi:hypothetical protein
MIIILLIIIIILIILLILFNKKETFKIPPNIGNFLVGYFFSFGKSMFKQENFIYNLDKEDEITFFNHIPRNIIYDNNIKNDLIKNNITDDFFIKYDDPAPSWIIISKNLENYWLTLRPYISNIMNDAFIKSNIVKKVDCPVIHFRCADVPFMRHNVYHLQKYKFFKQALDTFNERLKLKTNKVIILYSNTHRSQDKEQTACNVYLNSFKKYLNDNNYNVEISSNSSIEDLSILFYAPAVISTCSSFSFIGGFFNINYKTNNFISAGHYRENELNSICNNCNDWLIHGYDLENKDVKDYYDTDTVIKQLME